jgi:hypothetical protein
MHPFLRGHVEFAGIFLDGFGQRFALPLMNITFHTPTVSPPAFRLSFFITPVNATVEGMVS